MAHPSLRRRRRIAMALIPLLTFAATVASAEPLVESGSTLMYPLMVTWARAFDHADSPIEAQNTGSGQGVADVVAGRAHFAISDAYRNDVGSVSILQIPLAISGVMVTYNVPQLRSERLQLTGPLLAKIYLGEVRWWDAEELRAANPRLVGRLPHREITALHRADSSGTTFVFTEFLSRTALAWQRGPGYGTRVRWPLWEQSAAATGNGGMLHSCEAIAYCIAYIGVTYHARAEAAGLGTAAIRNAAGAFVPPTAAAIRNASVAKLSASPAESLVDSPGAQTYPIANYEYVLVAEHQPTAVLATELRAFLRWVLSPTGGSADNFLGPVRMSPLPDQLREPATALVQRIHN